jgi:3-dehydroquinate dehydratase type I
MEALAIHVSGVPVGYELRLDYLQDFSQFDSQLHQMLTRLHFPQTIATCRLAKAGGMLRGTLADQQAILLAAVRAGCQWVDVEIETVQEGGMAFLRELRPAKVIVSFHDFQRTPPLAGTYRRLVRLPVQAVKIATHARHLRDNLQIRRLLKAHRRRNPRLVALAMGAPGIPSRLLCLRWGSAFTYAAPLNISPAAAGQISAEVMRSVYRVERLDTHTQIYGVLGSHASISLSPAMQNAAFQAKHVNAVFLPCQTSQLADFLTFARRRGRSPYQAPAPGGQPHSDSGRGGRGARGRLCRTRGRRGGDYFRAARDSGASFGARRGGPGGVVGERREPGG